MRVLWLPLDATMVRRAAAFGVDRLEFGDFLKKTNERTASFSPDRVPKRALLAIVQLWLRSKKLSDNQILDVVCSVILHERIATIVNRCLVDYFHLAEPLLEYLITAEAAMYFASPSSSAVGQILGDQAVRWLEEHGVSRQGTDMICFG